MAKKTSLFGENLRSAIQRKNLSYTQGAKDIGITLSFLNQLMRGEREPSLQTIIDICAALDISASELIEPERVRITLADLASRDDKILELIKALATSPQGDKSEFDRLKKENDQLQSELMKFRQDELEIKRNRKRANYLPEEFWEKWPKAELRQQAFSIFFVTLNKDYLAKVNKGFRDRILRILQIHHLLPEKLPPGN